MPLKSSSHRLLCPLLKSVHILGQKKAVHQTLGNTTPFTFLPHPYTNARREWLAVQLNLGCHACTAWEEDATLTPTWVCGSWMTMPLDGWGGIRITTSLGPVEVCSTTHCLFRVRPIWEGGEGGAVWPRPWSGCCCAVCLAPSTKPSMVMVFWVTMSPLRSDSISERLVISMATCSVTYTGASGSTGSSSWAGSSWTGASSSTGTWASSRRRRDTRSAYSSRNGASSSEQVYRRPSSRASPTVNLGERKFVCQTLM